MRKLIRSVGVFLFMVGITAHAQTITPQAEQRAKDIVTKMTLQEKIEYISGYTSFLCVPFPVWEYLKSSWLTGRREFVIMLPRALYILPEYFPLLLGTGNYFIS